MGCERVSSNERLREECRHKRRNRRKTTQDKQRNRPSMAPEYLHNHTPSNVSVGFVARDDAGLMHWHRATTLFVAGLRGDELEERMHPRVKLRSNRVLGH